MKRWFEADSGNYLMKMIKKSIPIHLSSSGNLSNLWEISVWVQDSARSSRHAAHPASPTCLKNPIKSLAANLKNQRLRRQSEKRVLELRTRCQAKQGWTRSEAWKRGVQVWSNPGENFEFKRAAHFQRSTGAPRHPNSDTLGPIITHQRVM